MGNVLSKAKQEQVIALGRLGLVPAADRGRRRVFVARRLAVTCGQPGWHCVSPGGWGPKSLPKPATLVITGSDGSKPAMEVTTGSGPTSRQFKTGHTK